MIFRIRTMNTQRRAKAGGEVALNGEFYKGCAFIATTEHAKGAPQAKRKPLGKREVDFKTWEVQPLEGAIAIYPQLSGIEIFQGGKFVFNPNLRGQQFATAEAIARRESLIKRFNNAERWT